MTTKSILKYAGMLHCDAVHSLVLLTQIPKIQTLDNHEFMLIWNFSHFVHFFRYFLFIIKFSNAFFLIVFSMVSVCVTRISYFLPLIISVTSLVIISHVLNSQSSFFKYSKRTAFLSYPVSRRSVRQSGTPTSDIFFSLKKRVFRQILPFF